MTQKSRARRLLELDEALPRKMRAAFQFQPDVAHVYLGSKQHLLHRVFTDANAPLYNSARVLPLGPIPTDAFTLFIQERFEATSNRIMAEAIEHLLGITGGHPHDAQKLCYFVWNLAQARRQIVEVADVDLRLRQVLRTDTARYSELWESTPNQRRVLEAVARSGGKEDIRSQPRAAELPIRRLRARSAGRTQPHRATGSPALQCA